MYPITGGQRADFVLDVFLTLIIPDCQYSEKIYLIDLQVVV